MRLAVATMAAALVGGSPGVGAAQEAGPAALQKALDEAWPLRDAPEVARETERRIVEAARAFPDDPGLLWRRARWSFWLADTSTDKAYREKTAKVGWDLGEFALAKEPENTDARYWAAVSCGTYGDALGIITALRKGIEGKFRANLDWVVARAPGYDHGGPGVTLGRYHATLPWPKKDEGKAIDIFRKVLEAHPKNLRSRLYLAEVLMDEGDKEAREALALVGEVLAATPGAYDAPEERHIQRLARVLKPRIEAELK